MTFHRRTALVFYRTVLEKDIKTLVCLDTSQIMRIRTSHHTWVIRIASEDNNYNTIQNKAVIALPDGDHCLSSVESKDMRAPVV